jgi:serine/threonine-protein kinase RsbT
MKAPYEEVRLVLSRYLAPMNVESTLGRAMDRCALRPSTMSVDDVPALARELDHGIRLFLDPATQAKVRDEISALGPRNSSSTLYPAPPEPRGASSSSGWKVRNEISGLSSRPLAPSNASLAIQTEADIGQARALARSIAQECGAKPVKLQKFVTIASELARNIAMYTPGGQMDFTSTPHPTTLRLRATDNGRGIPNLDEIMAGNYRSKTGMGMGLRGVKRLVDRFDIETDPLGTRIEIEIKL